MKYGLKEEIIDRIKEIFSYFPEVEKVIIYGSRAKGNYKPGSDIDFCIKGQGLSLSILNKISIKLDELNLPYLIDLSNFENIENADLLNHLARVGIDFYTKGN